MRAGEVKPRQLLHLSLPAIVDPMTIVSRRRRQIIKILYVIYFAPYFHFYPQLFSISYEDYAHTHTYSPSFLFTSTFYDSLHTTPTRFSSRNILLLPLSLALSHPIMQSLPSSPFYNSTKELA